MNEKHNQDIHQLLCAVLLGEATPEETTEVEAALEASADLRAEKERLEATIGLVREHLGDEVRLPEGSAEAILARGSVSSPPSSRFASLKAAAVLFFTLGAWAVYQEYNTAGPQDAVWWASTELATAEETTPLGGVYYKVPGDSVAPGNQLADKNSLASAKRLQDQAAKIVAGLKTVSTSGGAAPAPFTAGGPSTPGPAGPQAAKGGGGGGAGRFGGRRGGARALNELPKARAISESDANLGLNFSSEVGQGGSELQALLAAATAPVASVPNPNELEALSIKAGAAVDEVREAEALKEQKEALRGLGYLTEPDGESDSSRTPLNLKPLSLEQRAAIVGPRADLVFHSCIRMPDETPSQMYFRFWGDNAFEDTRMDALSTFSVDVDTASYALARRMLMEGTLPQRDQIRTEEFLNYFKPDVQAPVGVPFAIETEMAPSLFGGREDRWMLRVAVRGREVSDFERKPVALTFVVDVSGSMRTGGRLELVKKSLRILLTRLEGIDSVTIISFNKEAHEVLGRTSALNRGTIENALLSLSPGGGTNAETGLKKGFEVALANLDPQASNRVVFLSDGMANMGETDQDRINADVSRFRDQGIYLNTIGVGMGGVNDTFLEQLADKGDGVCNYIDSPKEARRALVENFTGTFEPIARDVKIQVEFDPNQVLRYRLLGYENRAIADADFRNDTVDAGEVGAGHQVVALYEIERPSGAAFSPLATVHLRWKAPKNAGDTGPDRVTEISHVVHGRNTAGSFRSASNGYRASALVAQFAEFLRRSTHAKGDSWETLLSEGQALDAVLGDPDFTEFLTIAAEARRLSSEAPGVIGPLESAIDAYRRNYVQEAELELAD
jgi:Ca-activated chloride channel family protein